MSPAEFIGFAAELEYPACNANGVTPRWERRRVTILAVRDLEREPLNPATLENSPALRRCRWLVRVWDHDRLGERSLYWDSIRRFRLVEGESVYAVAWVSTDESWQPDGELPDNFKVEETLIENVSAFVAEIVCDAANALAKKIGLRGHWAAVLEQACLPRQM